MWGCRRGAEAEQRRWEVGVVVSHLSDFCVPSSACLATLYLDGAGSLSSLAACDSSTLLCATSSSGIHVLRLREGAEPVLEEVGVF